MAVIAQQNAQPQLELVKVESMPNNTIVVDKLQLYNMWQSGILNAVGFVAFAIEFDRSRIEDTGKFDVDFFIDHWSLGEKEITEDMVLKALVTLQKKEKIELGDRQLSLTLL